MLTSNDGKKEYGDNENLDQDVMIRQHISHVQEESQVQFILEEIKRLKEENSYLTTLIRSLFPRNNTKAYNGVTSPSPAAIQIRQQQPTVLKLKKNKNNSKFIIPIFKPVEDNVMPVLDQIYKNSFLTKPKLHGLDLLKKSPLTDASWKLRTSRFKRSLKGFHEGNLILKRPPVFNQIAENKRVKSSLAPVSSSPLIINSEPSTFYQVPPPGTGGPDHSFLQRPPETGGGTSYYGDVSLHPSSVIQELQQQVLFIPKIYLY